MESGNSTVEHETHAFVTEKQPDGAVFDAGGDWRPGGFPVLGRREDDHRRAVVHGWRLDGPS